MGKSRNQRDAAAFPPGKSPDEIALIVAELGEELGVWTQDVAGVVPELVPAAADAKRRPSKRPRTTPPRRTPPRRTTPPPVVRASEPNAFEHDVDYTSLHGAKPPSAPTIDEDTVDLVVAELIDVEPREESVLELAPDQIVEIADNDVDDDDEDALDPLEVSFIEFLDQAADDVDDVDDIETIRPVSLDRPRSTAAYPPVPRRARPVSRITWTLRDETTATDMFVA